MSAAEPVKNEQGETGRRRGQRRVLNGIVVSDKMDKTVIVQVTRRFKHPRYEKYVNRRARYKAHDEQNEGKLGDKVSIMECRPLSRGKRWRLQEVLEKAPIV